MRLGAIAISPWGGGALSSRVKPLYLYKPFERKFPPTSYDITKEQNIYYRLIAVKTSHSHGIQIFTSNHSHLSVLSSPSLSTSILSISYRVIHIDCDSQPYYQKCKNLSFTKTKLLSILNIREFCYEVVTMLTFKLYFFSSHTSHQQK